MGLFSDTYELSGMCFCLVAVLMAVIICPDEKIRPGLGSDEVAVLVDEVLLGQPVTLTRGLHYVFVRHAFEDTVVFPLRMRAKSHRLRLQALCTEKGFEVGT
jgi:hypothetical protein